jgi:heparosan-N-sulfate-glucuronate 5-epimerase
MKRRAITLAVIAAALVLVVAVAASRRGSGGPPDAMRCAPRPAGTLPKEHYDRTGPYAAFAAPRGYRSPYRMVNGVPIVDYDFGSYMNPTTTAQHGLIEWTVWSRYHDRAALRSAITQADWLVANQRRDGTWGYPFAFDTGAPRKYHLDRGWASGLAQGNAISLLTRVWRRTHQRRYLTAANRAVRPLEVSVGDGGLSRQRPGGVWFEEYPTHERPSFVLNGNLFTLIGLYDLADVNRSARRLLASGYAALARALPSYDAGSCSYYSAVDHVSPPPKGYSPIIRRLLFELDDVLPNRTVRHYAVKWSAPS